MCRVTVCCCGCTLKTGAITSCVLTAINALFNIIFGVLFVIAVNAVKTNEDVRHEIHQKVRDYGSTGSDQHSQFYNKAHGKVTADEVTDAVIIYFKVCAGFAFLVAIVLIVAFISLLIGILAERAGFVMVWLVTDMICIVLSCLFAVMCFISNSIIFGVAALGANAFYIYMWIVVLNFYRELRDGGGAHRATVSSPATKAFI